MFFTTIIIVPLFAIGGGHTPTNGSDVLVTYTGHSEAGSPVRPELETPEASVRDVGDAARKVHDSGGVTGAADEVIFIPNEKPVVRNEDLRNEEAARDVLTRNQLPDNVNVGTESPNQDVVFISGKNHGSEEKPDKRRTEKRKKEKVAEEEDKGPTAVKLDCSNLDCEVAQVPVCGGKLERKRWTYRLFLNECFFRKVNCAFRNRGNRYKQVPIDKCAGTAAVFSERPVFKLAPLKITPRPQLKQNDTRRSISSRRSLNMGPNGQFCSHPCPVSCTEEYDPQCAVSATGQKRVFLNHCKLDHNSCLYRAVWHRRPLSWCVGGKMADIQQNRGFIAWMQRNGVVDRKGRLALP
ncbi:unnamed protein product, partial [Iphiclides podalirius]